MNILGMKSFYIDFINIENNNKYNKYGVNGFIYKDVSEMKELILKYENMSEQERQNLKNSTRNSVLNSGELQLGENMIKIYDMALDNYIVF